MVGREQKIVKFQFVGTKKKVKYCSDKISGQGEREWGVGIDTKKALPYTWEKKVQKPIDKISGQGEREWGVDIDIKKALPYTWEKKVKKTHW